MVVGDEDLLEGGDLNFDKLGGCLGNFVVDDLSALIDDCSWGSGLDFPGSVDELGLLDGVGDGSWDLLDVGLYDSVGDGSWDLVDDNASFSVVDGGLKSVRNFSWALDGDFSWDILDDGLLALLSDGFWSQLDNLSWDGSGDFSVDLLFDFSWDLGDNGLWSSHGDFPWDLLRDGEVLVNWCVIIGRVGSEDDGGVSLRAAPSIAR